jgi:hypothetical protein
MTQGLTVDMISLMRANEDRLRQTETKEVPGASGQNTFYAQSTYTPAYLGETTPGATTYTTQEGSYARIGNVIVARGRVTWTAATGTGNATISLPFATASVVAVTIMTNNVTIGTFTAEAFAAAGASVFRLFTPANNAAGAFVQMEAAGDIIFQATYLI